MSANGVLDKGDRDSQVLILQKFMIKAFPSYNRYEATGYFGDLTDAGVREFQKRTGLVVDGKVGPATKAKMATFGLRLDGTAAPAAPAAPATPAPAAPAPAPAASSAPASVVHPAAGTRITSTFGARWGEQHLGVDFAGAIGTPIKAPVSGTIIRAGTANGFGLAVYLKDANGYVHTFGHVDTIKVSNGQSVKAGDVIATLGNRGQSTGPHLHYEVHTPGTQYGSAGAIDPLTYLRGKGLSL